MDSTESLQAQNMTDGFSVMPAVSQSLTVDLKGRLQAHLDGLKKDKIGDRFRFIPRKLLRQLFTLENLTAYLKRYLPDVAEHKELASYIKDAAQQTFAILLLIDEPMRIHALKEECSKASTAESGMKETGIDEVLFMGQNGGARSYCSKQKLEQNPQLGDIAEKFDATQYLFPPFLSTADTPEYDPMRFVFPAEGPVKRRIGGGSFGVVWEMNIENDYIEYSEDDPSTVVACKILKTSIERPDWEMLKREVNVVKARQHPHVTPIYASFMACRPIHKDRDDKQRLHIMMPRARMDMRTWMKEKPCDNEFSPEDFKEHIWITISGLISALTYIHREIGGEVGYHGDIKPPNILLFKESRGYVWKLSDFGSANLKPSEDTATTTIQASPQWAPEEFQDGQKHGRLGDIWSLGCVFFHLVIMLLYGWDEEGLKKFEKQVGGEAFHKNKQLLRRWIQHLEKEAQKQNETQKQDMKVEKLLLLVQDMLRAQRLRPFSWEIDVGIYCIRNPTAKDDDIEQRLKSVIQRPRYNDREINHKPMERAKRLGRQRQYLQFLRERGWSEDQSSARQQITAANTISPFQVPKSEIPPRLDLITRMTQALDQNRMLVLHGLRGIGTH
ncbi:kinase-like protein [Aaosphaeria arxii CBS 175.79]|uniref:Kinase-like protein n=1 Tax=Aaosphaeria arxii CBS 175.79 TaxID=1450172 RepID=A0A6A5XQ83_9PLEO|nr:kinase-like protein [Aaosphaeria arxii CBS 175.79]KAF2014997.1 kinase-like protein [Aaosphaeria arxii CBS 175.79]